MSIEIQIDKVTKDWEPIQKELFDMFLKDTKDLWENGKPDEEFLKDITTRMAKSQIKLKKAKSENNKNAIYQYQSSLESLSALLSGELKTTDYKLAKGGASLLTKIVNFTSKTLVIGTLSDGFIGIPKPSQEKIEEAIGETFDEMKDTDAFTGEKIMAQLEVTEIANATKEIMEQFYSAKNWQDYFVLGNQAVAEAMEAAMSYTEKTGEEKKQFVIEAFRFSYREFNPDLPFVDGPAEDFIEEQFLTSMLPTLVDKTWDAFQKFSKKSEVLKAE